MKLSKQAKVKISIPQPNLNLLNLQLKYGRYWFDIDSDGFFCVFVRLLDDQCNVLSSHCAQ